MKTILLTSDLSTESRAAFSVANKIAKAFGAEVIVLSVIESLAQTALAYAMDYPVFPDPDMQKQVLDNVKSQLDTICSEELADLKVSKVVLEASQSVQEEIINYAESHKADMIVMSTHGRAGITRLIIGSVAEKVVRSAKCPVLTVPVAK